jgi:hypothetical protein
MTNAFKGFVLAAANVCVVAFGFAIMEARDVREAVQIMFVLGFVGMFPGLPTGLILGSMIKNISPRWRVPALLVPAWTVVTLLGMMSGLFMLIPLACIPTAAAVGILVRWTREDTPLPTASLR